MVVFGCDRVGLGNLNAGNRGLAVQDYRLGMTVSVKLVVIESGAL
jgi:hypothetical protein